jgi:hypothetical protein
MTEQFPMATVQIEMAQRKRQNPIVSRTARLSKDVAAMLDLYAEEQRWSANTAMDTILRRYLEGLGYKEKTLATDQSIEAPEAIDTN